MPPKAQASRAAGVSVNSVKDAILDSIDKLEDKMKANAKFFPFGINDIEVGVKSAASKCHSRCPAPIPVRAWPAANRAGRRNRQAAAAPHAAARSGAKPAIVGDFRSLAGPTCPLSR